MVGQKTARKKVITLAPNDNRRCWGSPARHLKQAPLTAKLANMLIQRGMRLVKGAGKKPGKKKMMPATGSAKAMIASTSG